MGFYQIEDNKGNIRHDLAPLTSEALEEYWSWEERNWLKMFSKREFNEFIFGKKRSIISIDKIVGKRYSPLVSGNLASQLTLTNYGIKKLPESIKLLNKK